MTPREMTAGLDRYSERGWAYVEEVREMIVNNQLHQLVGDATLQPRTSRLAFR